MNFRVPRSNDVYKVFRDKDAYWAAKGAKSGHERAAGLVRSSRYGLVPRTEWVTGRILRQEYVPNTDRAKIRTSLSKRDTAAVDASNAGLKSKYHDRGFVHLDANIDNIFDPGQTGGVEAVDATHTRTAKSPNEYVRADLLKLYREAEHIGRGETYLGSVGRVYGNSVVSQLREAA